MPLPIVLASTSIFRQELLHRLRLPFISATPNFIENHRARETAEAMALRLAEGKARSLQSQYPAAVMIGSDQVAVAQDKIYGKPGNIERARTMLQALSGQTLSFYTALFVMNTASQKTYRHIDHTQVKMRAFSTATIDYYLHAEPEALCCAGAAKSEGLGMMLIERIDSSDPHALIGLPMLRLIDCLLEEGYFAPETWVKEGNE